MSYKIFFEKSAFYSAGHQKVTQINKKGMCQSLPEPSDSVSICGFSIGMSGTLLLGELSASPTAPIVPTGVTVIAGIASC
jgi:hypothetical protein